MVDMTYAAPIALVEHCRRKKLDEISTVPVGTHDAGDVANLVGWLNTRDEFTDHDSWVNLGMAIKLEFGESGLSLWRLSHNDTVTPNVEKSKWQSFATEYKTGCVTLHSFFKRAHDLGWKGTVRPSVESMFSGLAQLASAPGIAPGAVTAASIGYDMANLPLPQTQADDDQNTWPTPEGGFLKSDDEFTDGFIAPDYLVDGILQKRFCYSLTAQTGVGKTTIAMRLTAHVGTGQKLGGIDVEPGSVIYFAGENPTDVQMRWLGLKQDMGLTGRLPVHFIAGTMPLSQVVQRITAEIVTKGITPSLIVVDTAAAYFEGDNDNDNVQAGNHARMLRSLCLLPGGPCVLILCHPTKGAKTLEEMTPRGGGAFLNEVDGNIGLVRDEAGTLVASAIGKFRGPEFPALNFELKVIKDHPRLVDTKGRQIPTIIAEPISAGEVERREERASTDENKVLEVLCNGTMFKNSDLAKVLGGWHHSKVARALKRLEEEKLATETKDYWNATPKGQKYVNAVSTAQPADTYAPITPSVGMPVPRMHAAPTMPPR